MALICEPLPRLWALLLTLLTGCSLYADFVCPLALGVSTWCSSCSSLAVYVDHSTALYWLYLFFHMCRDIAGVLCGMAVMSRRALSFPLCMAVATAELWKLAGLGHPHYQLKQLCSWSVPLFPFVFYLYLQENLLSNLNWKILEWKDRHSDGGRTRGRGVAVLSMTSCDQFSS
jgi:hypothetical protein